MQQLKIILEPDAEQVRPELTHLLKLLALNKGFTFTWASTAEDISLGLQEDCTLQLSKAFVERRLSSHQLTTDCLFLCENGKPDYLATAFFLVNSLQEYENHPPDALGRFRFETSYQHRFGNVKQNMVQHCFDAIARTLKLPQHVEPMRFFLSHDIDTVYEAILQDGFYAIRKGRLDIFLKLLFHVAMGRPDWLNMDLIMRLESEYDCRSAFFWIVKKGAVEGGLKNADYNFHSSRIQKIISTAERNGFENGIHKSISPDSFQQELDHFTKKPVANRYHYLRFNLPDGYNAIEEAGLKLDASLGFAETLGFRNNYGQPFAPYHLTERRPYSFVEVPLNVMDTTLFKYKRSSIHEAENDIFGFLETNKSNCVLSVLWHNNFFSQYKYKGYLPLYQKILAYLKENNFNTISPAEIITKYSMPWP